MFLSITTSGAIKILDIFRIKVYFQNELSYLLLVLISLAVLSRRITNVYLPTKQIPVMFTFVCFFFCEKVQLAIFFFRICQPLIQMCCEERKKKTLQHEHVMLLNTIWLYWHMLIGIMKRRMQTPGTNTCSKIIWSKRVMLKNLLCPDSHKKVI